MANSSNAYATERPLQTSITDWVAKNDQMDMARRQEQQEIEQIAQQREDKKNALYESRRSKFKPLTIEATGVKSTDQILLKILLKGVEEKHKLESQLNPNMSYEEYADLSSKIARIEDLPNKLKLSQDAFVTEAKGIQKLMDEGKIQKDPDTLKKLQSFSDGYFDVELDENYNPMIGLWDRDGIDGKGDGKPDILSYDQIVAGQSFGEQIPDLDFNAEFLKLGEKVGTKTDAYDSGFRKTTNEYVPPKFNKNTAIVSLYDEQGGFTPLAKSELRKMGFKDFKNIPQKAKDDLEERAIKTMQSVQNNKKTNDFNYGAAETKKQNTITNKRADKKDEENKVTGNVVEIPQAYNNASVKPTEGYKAVSIGGAPITLSAFDLKIGKDKKVLSDAQLLNWTVGRNAKGQRQIIAQVAYEKVKGTNNKTKGSNEGKTYDEYDDKGVLIQNSNTESASSYTTGSEKDIVTVPLTEAQAEAFRASLNKKGMNFKNVNEMKDAARDGSFQKESTNSNYSNALKKYKGIDDNGNPIWE